MKTESEACKMKSESRRSVVARRFTDVSGRNILALLQRVLRCIVLPMCAAGCSRVVCSSKPVLFY